MPRITDSSIFGTITIRADDVRDFENLLSDVRHFGARYTVEPGEQVVKVHLDDLDTEATASLLERVQRSASFERHSRQ